jgi:hypothetical protein
MTTIVLSPVIDDWTYSDQLIRTIRFSNGEICFFATDVAAILGYHDAATMVRYLRAQERQVLSLSAKGTLDQRTLRAQIEPIRSLGSRCVDYCAARELRASSARVAPSARRRPIRSILENCGAVE